MGVPCVGCVLFVVSLEPKGTGGEFGGFAPAMNRGISIAGRLFAVF